MKKLKIVLLIVLFLSLFSCDDDNYINTVKQIKTNGTITVNYYNCNTISEISTALLRAAYPNDNYKTISSEANWIVEGDLGNNAKMIKVSYKEATVRIKAYKNGDYVNVFPAEITLESNNKTCSIMDFLNINYYEEN